ncbi:MAG: HAD-IA family hydrolase [Phycisphaeraceae bacterium]|nr:HAD-IA family hydrolase [Phycisphaeraceae bacterium]
MILTSNPPESQSAIVRPWIIFDAMGVIYPVCDDVNDLLVPYIHGLTRTVSTAQINDLYHRASLGRISSEQFWSQLGLAHRYPAVEHEYLSTRLRIDPLFLSTAEKLAERYPLAMLSNDVGIWSSFLRKRFHLDRLFALTIISAEVGLRKPDARIYELLLQRIGAAGGDCLFIDDRIKNLLPARKLGIQVVHFQRVAGETSPEGETPFASINNFAELETAIAATWP